VVAGAGHLVQEDAPEAIVGAIHPFLAAHAQALSTPVE
jgi:pimeloyl-ACP methyl ester carboxylesterase